MLDYVSYISATIAGLMLFSIGVLGLSGMPFSVNPSITHLLEPLGWATKYDTAYFIAFIFMGIWLVLSVFVKLAAVLALALVVLKIVIVR